MSDLPLWKRCRILANPVRLNMLSCLDANSRLYVQEVAQRLGLREDVASKNLQLLVAGGFLVREPVGKYLYCSLMTTDELLSLILQVLVSGRENALDQIIRVLTAVTHERRIILVSLLKKYGAMEKGELFFRSQVSAVAGRRHLSKLIRRGWVSERNRVCRLEAPKEPLMALLMDKASLITLAQV